MVMREKLNAKRTAYNQTVHEWDACQQCTIGLWAYRHVFGKGSLYPYVMFIGEAPGKSEDVMGRPFTGIAGGLLHYAINEAGGNPARIFYTNLLCCRPTDEEGGHNRQPNDAEINNCKIRLFRTILLVDPRIIVLLGKVPQRVLMDDPQLKKFKRYGIEHPSWILRQGGIKSKWYPMYVNKLKEIFNNVRKV